MKKIVITLLLGFCVVLSGFSQKDRSTLKKAYKYRTDIDVSVLKQTKQWSEKVGVLHSDWIENRNGKSMDLQGNILFPQYNYTQLERQGDYWVMTVNGKKGLIGKDGSLIVDFAYNAFDFSHLAQGYIVGIGQGGNKQIDIENPMSYDEMCDSDMENFLNNGWADRFGYYYNQNDFKNARFCLDYYNNYEQSSMKCSYSLPFFQRLRYDLLLYKKQQKYPEIIQFIQSSNVQALNYDGTKDMLVLSTDYYYAPEQVQDINKETGYINDIYTSSKNLFAVQQQLKAERQERAAIAAAIIAGAALTTAAVMAEQQQQNKAPVTTNANAGVDAVPLIDDGGISSSSSSSSSSSKSEDDDYYEYTCTYCNGTGRETIDKNLTVGNFGIEVQMVRCSECGKEYDKKGWTHKHQTCSHCNGKGKIRKKL